MSRTHRDKLVAKYLAKAKEAEGLAAAYRKFHGPGDLERAANAEREARMYRGQVDALLSQVVS